MAKKSAKDKEAELAEREMEDRLDDELFKALEIMKLPPKLFITWDHNFVDYYAVPIFEGNYVVGMKWQADKHALIPVGLLTRLAVLEDAIEAVEGKRKRKRKKKKPTSGRRGRKSAFSPEKIVQILQMKEQGMKICEIANVFGVNHNTVSRYIKQHKNKEAKAI
ncbi:helix-turn-helix domain-containing protein [Listeria booriae]|uniref:helix-turn-helix domain-containing protein n=1 Tax=Listeria booriae TaxID=1552123 RepID=UPI00162A6600|nr:helix-turn-helix domain-containing protein [Listeria booriae]MBC2392012.1 Hin recombinase [Listeria booriae]